MAGMFDRKTGPLGKRTAPAPGSMIRHRVCAVFRSWPNPGEVTMPVLHFIQEGSGREIRPAVASRLQGR